MKWILGLIFLLLLVGCITQPTPPSNQQPTLPPVEPPPVIKPPEEEPIVTDVNLTIVKSTDGIHIQSGKEDDLVYSPQKVCENGVCLLSLQYSHAGDLTVHITSNDYNVLNYSSFDLNKSNLFTVAVTEEPVLITCIFSYAKNDHTYVSNYFATFKHVCLFLDELATETGITIHPNYALVWNSQYHTAGEYLGSDIIFLSQENPYQLSPTIMHEITHSLMEEAHFPNWINEGLAEYYADKALDIFHPKTKYAEGLEKWTFGSGEPNVSNSFYESAHTTVQNFAEKYGEDTLRELTHHFIDHPFVFTIDVTKIQYNTETILAKMRSLTGDENITSVEYLANLHKKK